MSEFLFKRSDGVELIFDREHTFDYPDMIKISAPTGVNSFFHALLQSFNQIYHTEHYKNSLLEKETLIAGLRKDVAESLVQDSHLQILQQILAPTLKYNERLTVDSIYEEIKDSTKQFKLAWIGIFMYYLKLDIYILDQETWNVYVFTEEEEKAYMRPGNRDVIVLLYDHYNYSTVGLIVDEEDNVATFFNPKSNFITAIKQQLHRQRERNSQELKAQNRIAPTAVNADLLRADILVADGSNLPTKSKFTDSAS